MYVIVSFEANLSKLMVNLVSRQIVPLGILGHVFSLICLIN